MASHDDIPALLRQLQSRSRAAQLAAAEALSDIAAHPAEGQAVAAASSIPPLVQLLSASGSGSWLAQRAAAHVLSWLALSNPAHEEAIASAGGIPALVRLLGSRNQGVREQAAGALGMLARTPASCAAIAKAGGIQPLVQLLGSAGEAQVKAAVALARMGSCPASKDDVAAAGGIVPLVPLLVHLLRGDDEAVQQNVAAAIAQLAELSLESKAALAAAGAIPALVRRLGHSNSNLVQQNAMAALERLANGSTDNQAAIAAAGAMPALTQRWAARTIDCFSTQQRHSKSYGCALLRDAAPQST